MTIALNLLSSQIVGDGGAKRLVKRYLVTPSSSYAGSGTTGDVFNPQTTPTNTNWIPRAGWSRPPDSYAVLNQPVGYVMRVQPPATVTFIDWGIRFFEAGADGGDLDEIANGAYPAAISGDVNLMIELSGPAL